MVIVCFVGKRGWASAGHSEKKGGLRGDNFAGDRFFCDGFIHVEVCALWWDIRKASNANFLKDYFLKDHRLPLTVSQTVTQVDSGDSLLLTVSQTVTRA